MILIDTHILVKFRLGEIQLARHEEEEVLNAHSTNKLFLSAISIWEIAMLQKQNRLSLHQPVQTWLQRAVQGISVLPISSEIALESVMLPNFSHKDPADRFIIATARVEGLKILTHDRKILDYIELGYVNDTR